MPGRPELSPTRTLAWLYSAAERGVLATLAGIEREIGASLAPALDHHVAHTRLAWWREECARCVAGRPLHPLTRELAAQFAEPAQLAGLAGFVDTTVWDLARATFETRAELRAYCARWSAAFVEPLARHAAPQLAPEHAQRLGRTLRELELLLALAADARLGRLRLPLDELESVHATPESLAAAQWPPGLTGLVRARHRAARAALADSVAALAPDAQAPLRALLVWAAMLSAHSQRLERDLPRSAAPGEYRAPLDGWRAWRAARRAQRNRLQLEG